jgi:hypothetical protein
VAYMMCAEEKPTSNNAGTPPGKGGSSEGELFRLAMREAERHKWIQSEKAGRDLGEAALWEWSRRYWWRWCRERWIEHLSGERYWSDLDHNDFGLLRRTFHHNIALAQEIVTQIKQGGENLNIIIWALKTNQDMRQVMEILELLDINSRRLTFLPT